MVSNPSYKDNIMAPSSFALPPPHIPTDEAFPSFDKRLPLSFPPSKLLRPRPCPSSSQPPPRGNWNIRQFRIPAFRNCRSPIREASGDTRSPYSSMGIAGSVTSHRAYLSSQSALTHLCRPIFVTTSPDRVLSCGRLINSPT